MSVEKKLSRLSAVFLISLLLVFSFPVIISAIEDLTEPDTDITFITDRHGIVNYGKCVSYNTYIPENNLRVYGVSEDDESIITNAQFKKDSIGWQIAIVENGDFDSHTEIWYSADYPSQYEYSNDWHTVCGRATNSYGITEIVDEDDCCTFCVDSQAPDKITDIAHENPSLCVSNYINEAPEFSWTGTDDGCAGLDYYEIEVYYSNGDLYYIDTTTSNSITINYPGNEENYYIKVRAADKAGNKGSWSEKSEDVYYDIENPDVAITSPAQRTWFEDDFVVEETDEDNLALWKCEYKIVNEEEIIVDWTELDCNSPLTVDISEDCPEDGTCTVHKKAIDNACNTDNTYKWFKVDQNPPTTIKTLSQPSYPGPNELWPFISWFIKPETTITLFCDDGGGKGCDKTYYRIRPEGGEWGDWTEYAVPFTLGEDDGVYHLEYYSTDVLGNIEETKTETDKIDTEAPATEKTYEGIVFEGLRFIEEFSLEVWTKYISGETKIVLSAEDTESGVKSTYFQILTPDEEGYEEWYGKTTNKWYETYDECAIANCAENTALYCKGAPEENSCSSYTEEQCSALAGCGWITEEAYDTCEGTPNLCGTYEYSEKCEAAGCEWADDICGGEPSACNTYEESETCEAAGCNWNSYPEEQYCKGTPELSCYELEELWTGKCEETSGCNWIEVEIDCENCIETYWSLKWEFMHSDFCDLYEVWCLYHEPISFPQTCDHKICYFSSDNLDNSEESKCQVFSVDNTPPVITLLNPTEAEATDIHKCVQSIVAIVEDDKTGIKEVRAELYDGEELVRTAEMKLTTYGNSATYEALMDKAGLPAGEYTLIVKAEDNVGNTAEVQITEILKEGVFVEYIEDPICIIDPETGGECNFIFHICMRSSDSVKMWMGKLGQVVTPGMMNAEISRGDASAEVGLWDNEIDAGLLSYGEAINGKTTFNLHLDIPSNIASMIGAGAHTLDYLIESYSSEEI